MINIKYHKLLGFLAAGVATASQIVVLAYAAQTVRVSQKDRSFNVAEITIAAGDTIQFGNDDEFIHQVYVASKTFNFDTDKSPPGNTIDIKFPISGTFEVHCHIHPKMGLIVHVQ